jgi:hypothetical protein
LRSRRWPHTDLTQISAFNPDAPLPPCPSPSRLSRPLPQIYWILNGINCLLFVIRILAIAKVHGVYEIEFYLSMGQDNETFFVNLFFCITKLSTA